MRGGFEAGEILQNFKVGTVTFLEHVLEHMVEVTHRLVVVNSKN